MAPEKERPPQTAGADGTRLDDERLRFVLLATRDAVYDCDIPSGVVWRNDVHQQIYSPGESQIEFAAWRREHVHPDDLARVQASLDEAFAQQQPRWTAEYRFRRADGSFAVIHERAAVIYDEAGKPARLVGVMSDITDQKTAQAGLIAEHQRYRALVRAASRAVWTFDTLADHGSTGDGVSWWETVTGQTNAETTNWGWLAAIHPEDREYARNTWMHCRKTGSPYDIEYRVRTRTGAYRQYRVTGVPVPSDEGTIHEWVGMFTDVTERWRAERAVRESEARFRTFMDHSPAAAWIADADGRVLYSNRTFWQLFQLPEHPSEDMSIFDLFQEATARMHLETSREVARTGRPIERVEIAPRKDGTEGSFLVYRFPLRDLDGSPIIGTIAADITEFERLEEQLRQTQKMDAVGQLAGGVAHDFNNLLTVINGFTELALGNLDPDDSLAELLREVKHAGDAAAALTRQLLAFSRKTTVQARLIDLNALLTSMEKMLGRLIREDIERVVTLRENLWPVKADEIQIEQIVLNLVLNARDAMPTGGRLSLTTENVTIDATGATLRRGLKPGDYVRMSVVDTGCGMDQETVGRIFEPFFTTKASGAGTGMGLAVVYGIVKQFGGYIAVDSRPGHGTTFNVFLPRSHDHEERAAAPDQEMPPEATETVLLVEDEDSVRQITRMFLTRQGYTVLEARDGVEALTVAEQHRGPLHLLVTDVIMPRMGGVQLLQRLAASRPDLCSLFLSGYSYDTLSVRGVLSPDADFLQKPVDAATLARKIRDVLDRQHGPRERERARPGDPAT